MGRYSRQELEQAFEHYRRVAQQARESGDWNPYVDLFTEDARYVEHELGTLEGREQIREWFTQLMSGFTEMSFPIEWQIFDEEEGRVVFQAQNRLENPDPAGGAFQFASWTLLRYAGDNHWSYEEDIYNAKEADRVFREWAEARAATSE